MIGFDFIKVALNLYIGKLEMILCLLRYNPKYCFVVFKLCQITKTTPFLDIPFSKLPHLEQLDAI